MQSSAELVIDASCTYSVENVWNKFLTWSPVRKSRKRFCRRKISHQHFIFRILSESVVVAWCIRLHRKSSLGLGLSINQTAGRRKFFANRKQEILVQPIKAP